MQFACCGPTSLVELRLELCLACTSARAVAFGMGEEKKKERSAAKEGEPKKSALGDTGTIKRLMDDAVIQTLIDPDDLGYVEDTAMSNLKLVLGFGGVAASLVSHVYPATFPRNWWVLLLCCAVYFVTSGILQMMLSFVELESILLLRGKAREGGSRGPGLNVSSSFPRFQEVYTLGIARLTGSSLSMSSSAPFCAGEPPSMTADLAQRSWPCNKFFDEEGFFAENEFIDVSHAPDVH